MAKADLKTQSKLALELLASIKASGRNEATTPKILEAALAKLGGAAALGELIADQLEFATGKNLTPAQKEGFRYSPLVIHRYAELLTRLSVKNDERTSVDVSSLSEEDLRATLCAMSIDLVQSSAEFRELIVLEAISVQPDLIHKAMTAAGMQVVEQTYSPAKIAQAVEDFNAEAVGDDDD